MCCGRQAAAKVVLGRVQIESSESVTVGDCCVDCMGTALRVMLVAKPSGTLRQTQKRSLDVGLANRRVVDFAVLATASETFPVTLSLWVWNFGCIVALSPNRRAIVVPMVAISVRCLGSIFGVAPIAASRRTAKSGNPCCATRNSSDGWANGSGGNGSFFFPLPFPLMWSSVAS